MWVKYRTASFICTVIMLMLPNQSSEEEDEEQNAEPLEGKTREFPSPASEAGFESDMVFQLARLVDHLVAEHVDGDENESGFSAETFARLFGLKKAPKKKKQKSSRRQGRTFKVDPDSIYEVRKRIFPI